MVAGIEVPARLGSFTDGIGARCMGVGRGTSEQNKTRVARERTEAEMKKASARTLAHEQERIDVETIARHPMTEERKPLSDQSKHLMALGRVGPALRDRATRMAWIRTDIAALLLEYMHLEVGLTEIDPSSVPQNVKDRLLAITNRACLNVDAGHRVEAADRAVEDLVEWLNGPYDGVTPTRAEIGRRAIGFFCTRENEAFGRAVPAGKCGCGGTFWIDEFDDEQKTCSSCGRREAVARV